MPVTFILEMAILGMSAGKDNVFGFDAENLFLVTHLILFLMLSQLILLPVLLLANSCHCMMHLAMHRKAKDVLGASKLTDKELSYLFADLVKKYGIKESPGKPFYVHNENTFPKTDAEIVTLTTLIPVSHQFI